MTTPPLMFSHVGLYVKDIDLMQSFYSSVLGMVVTDRGAIRGRELVFMTRNINEHHQLVLASGRNTAHDARHINQISFQTPTLNDLRSYKAFLAEREDIPEVHQVNHGMAWSLYFLDPEGNRIELFTNSPWHVQQPVSDQLNLNLSDQVIVQTTKDKYYNYAGFQNRSEWQKKLSPTLRS